MSGRPARLQPERGAPGGRRFGPPCARISGDLRMPSSSPPLQHLTSAGRRRRGGRRAARDSRRPYRTAGGGRKQMSSPNDPKDPEILDPIDDLMLPAPDDEHAHGDRDRASSSVREIASRIPESLASI